VSSLQTRHEWIQKLAQLSEHIARIESYLTDGALDPDAYNLANCDAHSRLIARAAEGLILREASSPQEVEKLLGDLIGRQTYGAFAEIAAYEWLSRHPLRFTAQVKMESTEVLATKGSTLDGRIDFYDVYFDVKAFGLTGRLAQRLKEKLQKDFPGEEVLIEESWDVSPEEFGDLIRSSEQIASELRQKRYARRGRLNIRIQETRPVTVSMRSSDPYLLANEYALFPFSDAKQFTRKRPFILLFVVHPWFNALTVHNDFAGKDTIFTRSLARRAFMQFASDGRPLAGR
jgi:hypothetical protein